MGLPSLLAPTPLLACFFGDMDHKRSGNPFDHIAIHISLVFEYMAVCIVICASNASLSTLFTALVSTALCVYLCSTLVCFYVSVLAPAPLLVCLFGEVDNKRLENPSDHIGVAHSLCCYL